MKKILMILVALMMSPAAFAQEDMDLNSSPRYRDDTDSSNVDRKKHNDISFTPSLNLLHFPHPVEGGLELTFGGMFGVKYSQSFRPHFTVDGSKADFDDRSIALRAYPNQGPWFLALAYGRHEVNVKRHEVVNNFDTNIYANVRSDYVTPMTGWKWIYASGFTVGVEFGWIFPFNSSADVSSDQDNNPLVNANADYRERRQDAEDTANRFVKGGLPNIGLLEIGWTF